MPSQQQELARLDEERPPPRAPILATEASPSAWRELDGEDPTLIDREAANGRSADAYPSFISIAVGVALSSRNASFQIADSTARTHAGEYTQVGGSMELRPFARARDLGRALVLRAELAYALDLTDQGDAQLAPGASTFFRVSAHVGFLLPFGELLEIGPEVGPTWDVRQISPNPHIASAEYFSLHPTLRARLRLAGEALVLEGFLGYCGLLTRGELSAAYGVGGRSYGADAGLGLSGAIGAFFYAVRFLWSNYWHSFSGPAAIAAAGQGSDESLHLTALLGLAVF